MNRFIRGYVTTKIIDEAPKMMLQKIYKMITHKKSIWLLGSLKKCRKEKKKC